MFIRTGNTQRLAGARAFRVAAYAVLSASVVALAGCAGATYGTGKTSEQRLLEDVTGVLALGPKDKEVIDYKPRPALVKPATTAVLPPPQENIASSSTNPAWPESPEQRLARIRTEATENQNDPSYRSPVVRDLPVTNGPEELQDLSQLSPEQQRAEVLRRRKINNQGDPTTRRYLSEPPLTYRQPSETAPVGDIGKDEDRKAREAKRKSGGGGGGLGRLWPF
ncbi:hypothetical protein GCM10011385_26570 [Nitratireductor aestuarii]|uniref:DUF3035 domain-containing protein n=1 Tax=Nitratireductor aestuarii TaxID=1735103 RepID=A0A916RUR2_9HYPH|nr:hypothetical protein [Nitratireductor aestuarii]GGA71429.1 hypothetical protein GCM10011385_26570 [Nitratireductor aestuarii]